MTSIASYLMHRITFWLLISLSIAGNLHAAPNRHVFENQQIKMVITPRTAQQMAAFYEGREFPAKAINLTRNACFFTIGIHNKSQSLLWLDTNNWSFTSNTGPIALISREQWTQRWEKIGLQQRFQSTFRWTLLPNQLDFQVDEREGGNITLPRTDLVFTLTASFNTGADKKGTPINAVFKGISCAKDEKS